MSPLIADKKIVLQRYVCAYVYLNVIKFCLCNVFISVSSVLKGLDSNHQYEQNAAIEAAHELCQYSR